jgi:hypothetical protein
LLSPAESMPETELDVGHDDVGSAEALGQHGYPDCRQLGPGLREPGRCAMPYRGERTGSARLLWLLRQALRSHQQAPVQQHGGDEAGCHGVGPPVVLGDHCHRPGDDSEADQDGARACELTRPVPAAAGGPDDHDGPATRPIATTACSPSSTVLTA